MTTLALVLVDTSVWIRFFRSAQAAEAGGLDELLSQGSVATCAPIRAEVVSGAPTASSFERLQELFRGVEMLALPPDAWERVEAHRFALARKGRQASLVDLLIALTAHDHRVPLWTLDADFHAIATEIPLQFHRRTTTVE